MPRSLLVVCLLLVAVSSCWASRDVTFGEETQSVRLGVDQGGPPHARSLQQYFHCTYDGFCSGRDPAGAKNICCVVPAYDGSCKPAGSVFWVPSCAWFNAGPQVKSCCF